MNIFYPGPDQNTLISNGELAHIMIGAHTFTYTSGYIQKKRILAQQKISSRIIARFMSRAVMPNNHSNCPGRVE